MHDRGVGGGADRDPCLVVGMVEALEQSLDILSAAMPLKFLNCCVPVEIMLRVY